MSDSVESDEQCNSFNDGGSLSKNNFMAPRNAVTSVER